MYVASLAGGALSTISLPSLRRLENDGGPGRKHIGNISEGSQGRTLRAAFQLADVALGVSESIGQLLLAPAAINAQLGELCTERFR